MDDLNLEIRRKDESINMVSIERERVVGRLEEEESKWNYCAIVIQMKA